MFALSVIGTADALERQVCGLHAVIAGAQRELLRVIAELERREAFRADGARDMTDWVAMRLALDYKTARRLCVVARRLDELPALADALATGELSIDQVAAACRFVTPELDARVTERVKGLTPEQIERLGLELFPPNRIDFEQAYADRTLRMRWTNRRQMLQVSAKLPVEQGVVFEHAIRGLATTRETLDPDDLEHWPVRCADALVTLAEAFNATDASPERASLIVHIDAATIADPAGGGALLEHAGPIALETARRLACDAHRQTIVESENGTPIIVGRTQRTVSAWLLRSLHKRDHHCRFPGCHSTRHLHAHHITHWIHGGTTDASNLILLCSRHHRFVHESQWSIHGTPGTALIFRRPRGDIYSIGPPRLDPG